MLIPLLPPSIILYILCSQIYIIFLNILIILLFNYFKKKYLNIYYCNKCIIDIYIYIYIYKPYYHHIYITKKYAK